ncbi:uncharacterized protein LOC111015837 [Momordica charantia]|uniref:Uncharacterized protein LOC111015837 n=1 Tax=Momordica charantia TaxID=3673 RepID=A0A6J1CYT9_MOMCH|nr:uncharacterized protein LOC111015837 [Momordica charantia]
MQSQCEGHLNRRKWCGHKERCWRSENGEREEGKRGGKAGRCGEKLRCGAGALWLLVAVLPGFRKGKGEREEEGDGGDEGSGCISISISSRRVSLEKFECGSWASSGMVVHEDNEESGSLYFDLPIELIRNSVSVSVGAQSPVKAAFVFDKAKLAAAAAASSVSVRASAPPTPTSSSIVITPRLRKAREEFNALLEAHTTTL